MTPHDHSCPIEDVQNSPDLRSLDIDKVGIKSIRHPVLVRDKTGGAQHTVATFNMYESFENILREMIKRLEAKSCDVEMTFPYFINKTAPVSGVKSLLDYDVSFIGKIIDGTFKNTIKVVVPVTSLCPCSKKISDYGAHNQRSHVTVTAEINKFIWIEELIELIEKQASSELYGLLKRPDEKFVTEKAYDNPKFVEDMVRDVAAQLKLEKRINHFVVESENFESIHNHSAYALIEG